MPCTSEQPNFRALPLAFCESTSGAELVLSGPGLPLEELLLEEELLLDEELDEDELEEELLLDEELDALLLEAALLEDEELDEVDPSTGASSETQALKL